LYLRVTAHARIAAHHDGRCSRGITFVACRDGSHITVAPIQDMISPVGAMPCRNFAVGDMIEAADALSARPRQSAQGEQ
jgi:hypothetical protein